MPLAHREIAVERFRGQFGCRHGTPAKSERRSLGRLIRNRNVVWEMNEAVFIRNRQNVSIGFV